MRRKLLATVREEGGRYEPVRLNAVSRLHPIRISQSGRTRDEYELRMSQRWHPLFVVRLVRDNGPFGGDVTFKRRVRRALREVA
jgi:hypothetical protein